MNSAAFILASTESDLVVGLIVVAFWALSAIAKILKNVNAPAARRPPARPIALPPILPHAARPPAPAPRQSFPAQRRMPPMPARLAPKPVLLASTEKVYVIGKTNVPVVAPAAKTPRPPTPSVVTAVSPPMSSVPATAHHLSAASAASLRKWLTPKTLKKQYILTELLQPPLALRDGAPTF